MSASIGYFTANTKTYTTDPNGVKTMTPTPLALVECGTEHFEFDAEQVKTYGVDKMMCLEDPEAYELKGNVHSPEMELLEIKLWKCQNSTAVGSVKCMN